MIHRVFFLLSVCTLLAGGCARYEYELVEPRDLAEHIGERQDVAFTIHPMLYRLRSFDNRLIIRIENRSDEPVRLLGDQSFLIDPQGLSHPLQSQTIGPRAFIRMILPPPPPDVAPGPMVSVGLGFGSRFGPGFGTAIYQPIGPRYRYFGPYWEWNDQTDVRLSLMFQQGSQPPVAHPFLFHRRRM